MRHRIALCGFSEFEFRALNFSIQHPSEAQAHSFEVVDALADADFAVVDADSAPAVRGVVRSGRIPHSIFIGGEAPSGARLHLPRPIDLDRIHAMLDDLRDRYPVPRAKFEHPETGAFDEFDDEPTLPPALPIDEVDDLAPLAPLTRPGSLTPRTAPTAHATMPQDRPVPDMLSTRASAHSAARRDMLNRSSAAMQEFSPQRDVLVLDADIEDGGLLCMMLERFGFAPHPVCAADHAEALLASHQFSAFFVDLADNVSERNRSLALLERVASARSHGAKSVPTLLTLAEPIQAADKVRAELAGVRAMLLKPLGRADVARALDQAGLSVALDPGRL